MEDVRLSRDIRERFGDIHLAKNDPQLYIRLVHGDNTSTYVDAKKNMLASTERNVNYFEYDVSASEERYVLDRIKYLYDANVDY